MSLLRSAIGLALIVVSVLASTAIAAHPAAIAVDPSPATQANPDDMRWDDRFSLEFSRRFGNPYSAVLSTAAVFQGELYVAGAFQEEYEFYEASPVDPLRNIARWDGSQWAPVGRLSWTSHGISSPSIKDMVVHEGKLYATGYFSLSQDVWSLNIASWDGQRWEPLGEGLNDSGFALASYGGDLYVAGAFSQAGQTAAEGIARWDGTRWHAVGAGLQAGGNEPVQLVNDLVATPQGLYAGGEFGRSGAQQLHSLARWDGNQWSAVIPELRGNVNALEWHGGALYAAGALSFEIAVPASGSLLRWDGAQGEFLAAGLNSGAAARMVRSAGGELYASTTEKLYRWDGLAWAPFGRPLAVVAGIEEIIAYNATLHLVGNMQCSYADCTAKNVLAWTGDRWNGLGEGIDSEGVGALAAPGDAFYVAPKEDWDQQTLGSQRSYNLGVLNAAGWHDASLGINAYVPSLVAAGDSLYAARLARNATSSSPYYTATIARLDGGAWSTLPGVFNGSVNTLAYADGKLYAGGGFSAVGNTQAKVVARWDGAAWSALGDLQLSEVKELAVRDGIVYVSGSTGPNVPGEVVYRWDGAAWTLLGMVEGRIRDMAAAPDGSLYMAGGISFINTMRAALVVRWRAGDWENLSHDFRPTASVGAYNTGVHALEIGDDGAVYIGGLFESAVVPGMKSIARYDGNWHALGSGIDGVVFDLESRGGDIYVGGRLFRAGDNRSANVAIWHGATPSTIFVPLVVR